ncbi:MAG TPA: amidohydrolase family protein [Myxococcales bacterium]|nr:amidohydrolase family protein [Myxococcales bacterium]
MPSDRASSTLALVGATVHPAPGDRPILDGVVLVERATIAAVGRRADVGVPDGSRVLDCSGRAITAGFCNSHVHFFERKWADAGTVPADELALQLEEAFTRFGFTSVFDTGSPWENTRRIRERIESGEVHGPKIRSTGPGLVPPGAIPPDAVLGMMGAMKFAAPEISSAADASAAARRLLGEGVDGIKLFLSSPRGASLPQEALAAAVDEAHRAKKPVFAHPNSGADVLAAVRGGVDVIAHTTPHSGPWGETLLAAMREAGAALTPTLALWKTFLRHDRISAQQRIAEVAAGQLRAFSAGGGTVLFGTDLGAVDPDPGDEYALMAEAGMSFADVLAALTTAPARRLGDPDRSGRVAAGFEADLVVLEKDPSEDPAALAAVTCTIRGGQVTYRRAGPAR